VETFYRFLIQDIFPETEKVIYLDSDIIVLSDIAELYAENIDGLLLAAVADADFQGQMNKPGDNTKQYADESLKLKNPYGYFQAGVLVLNLSEMRKMNSAEKWLELASERLRYADQDVLNRACQGRVKYLDMSWNVLIDCNGERISEVIEYAPVSVYQEYIKAREAPKIVHYAGFKKPWQVPGEDFGELFWLYARQTPFYEILLDKMMREKSHKIKKQELNALRRIAEKILPKGSKIRVIIKKITQRLLGR
jgi:lipopolysaccharide biosynthesis glycosyltransferase